MTLNLVGNGMKVSQVAIKDNWWLLFFSYFANYLHYLHCQSTISTSTYLAVSRGNSFLLGDHFKFCMRVYLFLTLLAHWILIGTINADYHEVCMHHFSPYSCFMESGIAKFPAVYKVTSASKRSIRRFVITEKAPTSVKLGPRHNYHKRRAAIRHYANQTARPLWPLRRGPNFTLRDCGVNARLA